MVCRLDASSSLPSFLLSFLKSTTFPRGEAVFILRELICSFYLFHLAFAPLLYAASGFAVLVSGHCTLTWWHPRELAPRMYTWETGWLLGALGKPLWQELNLSLPHNPAATGGGVLTRSCLLAVTCITAEEHFTCGSSALELVSFPCFPSGHWLSWAFSKAQLFEQEINDVCKWLY